MRRYRIPFLPLVVLVFAIATAMPTLTSNPTLREELFLVFMLVTLASSINIIMGYTGYVSFGHIVFFGLGGYFAFYLMQVQGWHFLAALIAGAIPSALIALVIGIPILRLRGAYFALATVGINEAMRVVFNNWEEFGGAVGMFFNFSVYARYGGASQARDLGYYSMAAVAISTIAASYWIKRSKFGLSLMAIREDQDVAMVVGIDPSRAKVAAYVISAVFPAMAGAAFFFRNGLIEPGHAFELQRSIESLVMVVLGGIGTVAGPIVGAAVYEWLRGFLITNPTLASFQLSLAGLLLLVVVLFVTAGLVGWLRNRFPVLRSYIP
ncbi:MAG TPA: branched-chain amino acid ABC transporter permease [Candidatus Limnocylindria bacterium]|nr:branched-chain amino acid ABC transporter permease [Candidatus Limnocylindria bacterium]